MCAYFISRWDLFTYQDAKWQTISPAVVTLCGDGPGSGPNNESSGSPAKTFSPSPSSSSKEQIPNPDHYSLLSHHCGDEETHVHTHSMERGTMFLLDSVVAGTINKLKPFSGEFPYFSNAHNHHYTTVHCREPSIFFSNQSFTHPNITLTL